MGACAVLLGLILNTLIGWWWADPAAGMVIVYYVMTISCFDQCGAHDTEIVARKSRSLLVLFEQLHARPYCGPCGRAGEDTQHL